MRMLKTHLSWLTVALSALALLVPLALTTAGPASAAPTGLALSGPIVGQTDNRFYSGGTTNEHFSSPAVGDLYRNGRTEAVVGYPDGTVHIYPLTASGLGREISIIFPNAGPIQASPVIVDLNKDGWPDVIVATLGGKVIGFTPGLGNRTIFQVTTQANNGMNGNFATPAVADINRDGILDVVETSWGGRLNVWSSRKDSRGQFDQLRGFPIYLQDTSWSSPAVADLDGDGWPEIVFGYDCDGVPGQRCYPNYGGYVTVIRHDGTTEHGWPRFVPHQTVWSSPAIRDINGDGHMDVVVGTGNMPSTMSTHRPMDGGHYLFAFTGATGQPLPGFPARLSANVTSSPALGMMNGRNWQAAVVSEDGYLTVVGPTGQVVARTCVNDALSGCGKLAFHQSVAIADVDGDGREEIVVGGEQWLDIYRLNGTTLQLVYRGWPKDANHGSVTPHQFSAAPTVTSIGGRAWILLATDTTRPGGYAAAMYAFTTNRTLGITHWGTFKGSSVRQGEQGVH